MFPQIRVFTCLHDEDCILLASIYWGPQFLLESMGVMMQKLLGANVDAEFGALSCWWEGLGLERFTLGPTYLPSKKRVRT